MEALGPEADGTIKLGLAPPPDFLSGFLIANLTFLGLQVRSFQNSVSITFVGVRRGLDGWIWSVLSSLVLEFSALAVTASGTEVYFF